MATMANIRLLVAAYHAGAMWLLASLLVPFAIFVFVCLNWQTTRRPFLFWLAGVVLICVAFAIAPESEWMKTQY